MTFLLFFIQVRLHYLEVGKYTINSLVNLRFSEKFQELVNFTMQNYEDSFYWSAGAYSKVFMTQVLAISIEHRAYNLRIGPRTAIRRSCGDEKARRLGGKTIFQF